MSGRVAAGLLLMVVGAATALYGYNQTQSLSYRVGQSIGLTDHSAVISILAGAAVGLIGLILAVSGGANPPARSR